MYSRGEPRRGQGQVHQAVPDALRRGREAGIIIVILSISSSSSSSSSMFIIISSSSSSGSNIGGRRGGSSCSIIFRPVAFPVFRRYALQVLKRKRIINEKHDNKQYAQV